MQIEKKFSPKIEKYDCFTDSLTILKYEMKEYFYIDYLRLIYEKLQYQALVTNPSENKLQNYMMNIKIQNFQIKITKT